MSQAPDRIAARPLRSDCPINGSLEIVGDRWSLVVLRDIVFADRRNFRSLMRASDEGIASNILSSRLGKLTKTGLLTRHQDPTHPQKVEYRLTEAAIQLVPLLVMLGGWGARWLPLPPETVHGAAELAASGTRVLEPFMEELRERHLNHPGTRGPYRFLAEFDGVYAGTTSSET